MATEYLFSNNATTTLAQSVSATATVLNVASGSGSMFPSPGQGQAFAVTLVDAATGLTNEICYCTSRSGDQLTVVRGREGTNATAWQDGDTCANYITADVMESWLQESDLNGYITEAIADNRYVRFIDDTVNWPVQYIGVNKSTSAPWFKSGPNYYMLQPAGDYATNSALSGYLKNTNGGIGGEQAGTSLVYQTSAGRPFFSYNNNGAGGNLAWYSDVTAEASARIAADNNLQNQINGKQPAGNYVTGTSAGKKIVTFTASVSGTQDISFSGLSSVDVVLGSCSTQPGSSNQRGGMIQINSWTSNSVNVTGKFTSTNISDSTDLPCYFVAIGDA